MELNNCYAQLSVPVVTEHPEYDAWKDSVVLNLGLPDSGTASAELSLYASRAEVGQQIRIGPFDPSEEILELLPSGLVRILMGVNIIDLETDELLIEKVVTIEEEGQIVLNIKIINESVIKYSEGFIPISVVSEGYEAKCSGDFEIQIIIGAPKEFKDSLASDLINALTNTVLTSGFSTSMLQGDTIVELIEQGIVKKIPSADLYILTDYGKELLG